MLASVDAPARAERVTITRAPRLVERAVYRMLIANGIADA